MEVNKHSLPNVLKPALKRIDKEGTILKINMGRSRGGIKGRPGLIKIQKFENNAYKCCGYTDIGIVDIWIVTLNEVQLGEYVG